MNSQSSRSYQAAIFSKSQILKTVIAFLVILGIILFIDLDQIRNRLLFIYGLAVLLNAALFLVSFLRKKKEYELVEIAEEGITIHMPTKEIIQIPWNKDISVGYYELSSTGISSSVGTQCELILSSEPLPPSYQVRQTEHFSPDKYYENDHWKVSLGRGAKRWCQQQVDWIQNLKNGSNT